MNYSELEAFAKHLGATVFYGDVVCAFLCLLPEGPVIGMPDHEVEWTKDFMLAHELGHLVLGHGSWGKRPCIVQEIQANHWAKEALSGRLSLPRMKLKSA